MKISVIVPIYNMEKFITRAISCLKKQDLDESEMEVLLINDGSTDTTLQMLDQLCEDDKRFRISTIENHGYGYACNLGLQKATGDFVAIYEPDDRITSDFYSTLRRIAEDCKQVDVIRYSGLYREEENRFKALYRWKPKFTGKILDKYTLTNFWRSHPSVFNGIYRKNFLLQKSVFFCETPGASFQDAMFMVSLFYADPSIYVINDIKYTYVIHSMQSTKFVEDKIDFIIDAWKKEAEWIVRNGFTSQDFFLYRVFIQMENITKKVSYENKKKLEHAFKDLRNGKRYLRGSIPTFKQKIRYILT